VDVKKAIDIIHECVCSYDELSKRDYIFVFETGQKTICFVEIDFRPRNFRHLTGVSYPGDSINFYREALNKKLDPTKIKFRPDGRTKSKLEILPLLVALPNTARMVGKYDNNGFKLHTDFLAGSVTGCMGFIQETNGKYAPNTALKEDIRKICIHPISTIIATFSKSKSEPIYSRIEYKNSNVDLQKIKVPTNIKNRISPCLGLFPINDPEIER